MTEEAVTIPSAGLKLSGVVHVPRGLRPSERRGAFLVLHGFGSNKTSSNTMQPTKVLSDLGYVVLRFDMRGCGDSEGEFGRVICLEQVEDTRSALTFLARHPAVDPERIGLIGSSFGGAVAIYTGSVDQRVAAVISNGGWGDGERKFRGQHKSPQEWARFTNMLKEGREHRARELEAGGRDGDGFFGHGMVSMMGAVATLSERRRDGRWIAGCRATHEGVMAALADATADR